MSRGRYDVAGHSQVAGRPQSFSADRAGECLEGSLRAAAVACVPRAGGQLDKHASGARVGARKQVVKHRLRAIDQRRGWRVGARRVEIAALRISEVPVQYGGDVLGALEIAAPPGERYQQARAGRHLDLGLHLTVLASSRPPPPPRGLPPPVALDATIAVRE